MPNNESRFRNLREKVKIKKRYLVTCLYIDWRRVGNVPIMLARNNPTTKQIKYSCQSNIGCKLVDWLMSTDNLNKKRGTSSIGR